MPTTYINFHAAVNMQTVQNVMDDIAEKLSQGTDNFYFLISTPGGVVNSGLTLYNFLRAIPATVTMHNIGNVDSIGNAIFVAADPKNRFAVAHSTFMFHGIASDIENASLEERDARECLESILADQKRIADILVDRTAFSAEQAQQLFRETRTKDPTQALGAGLIAEIREAKIPKDADIVTLRSDD